MNAIFSLLSDDSPVIIDGRLLHAGRTGIGRITKLMIDTASQSKTVYIFGAAGEVKFENAIYLYTSCQKFGFIFLLQNFLINLLFFKKRIKIIFPHYFSAFCFLRKFVFVHDVMAITHYKRFYLRFALLKKIVLTAVVRLGLINADVACPSKFSCKTVETLFGISSEYLPNGTNLDVSKNMQPDLESTIELHSIPRPFIVGYVGNKRPHKNLPDLKQFCSLNGFELQFFDEFEIGSDRDDNLLSKFYSQVHAVALFSYCEGFGIPIIEGALFGKYIFCSKIPAFLELSDIGLNFVASDTVVKTIVKPNPLLIEQKYRFQMMKSYISSYLR